MTATEALAELAAEFPGKDISVSTHIATYSNGRSYTCTINPWGLCVSHAGSVEAMVEAIREKAAAHDPLRQAREIAEANGMKLVPA